MSHGDARAPAQLNAPIIRDAGVIDADAVSGLCRELGYNVAAREAHERIARISISHSYRLFVAETERRRLAGLVLVEEALSLTGPAHARIAALVVSEALRGSGLGRSLVETAEAWAHRRGLYEIRLTSREHRAGAHGFYERLGYKVEKTSKVFTKAL